METHDVETVMPAELPSEVPAPPAIAYNSVGVEGTEVDVLGGIDCSKTSINDQTLESGYGLGKLRDLNKTLLPVRYGRVLVEISKFDAGYIYSNVTSEAFGWPPTWAPLARTK